VSDAEAEAADTHGVVVDASVALQWVLPEPGAAAALALRERLRAEGVPAYVPELFWAETANALWRLSRRGTPLRAAEALEIFDVLRAAPLRSEPVARLAPRALEIACATGATVYDCVYIALAELRRVRCWTADRRLARVVAGTEWADVVRALA
jgi:predicted nucleic acid-binding protein